MRQLAATYFNCFETVSRQFFRREKLATIVIAARRRRRPEAEKIAVVIQLAGEKLGIGACGFQH